MTLCLMSYMLDDVMLDDVMLGVVASAQEADFII
jgi:hypothetical protein